MLKVINLYLDESGSKCPDRKSNDQTPEHKKDFFAFGGVLVKEEDEAIARKRGTADILVKSATL